MKHTIYYTSINRKKKALLLCYCSLFIAISASNGFADSKQEEQNSQALTDADKDACNPKVVPPLGDGSLQEGQAAQASGKMAVAIGDCTRATAQGASAIGYRSEANAANATAVGQHSRADSVGSLVVGSGAIVDKNAEDAIAIGTSSYVGIGAANSMAIGNEASIGDGVKNALAIGNGAKSSHSNSVALGSNSETSAAVQTTGTKIGDKNYNFAGINPESTISIGSKDKERTLTNLAAGRVDKDSTDGVNGSQLYATNQAVTLVNNRFNAFGNDVASIFGGGAGFNGDGSIRPPTYDFGKNKYNNIADVIGAINKDNNNIHDEINNLQGQSNNSVTYDPNPDGTRSNNITPVGGDPNAPVAIHNVADGKENGDVVNLGQLKKVTADANSYADTKTEETLKESKSYTDTAIKSINQHTDEQMSMLSGRVDDVQKEARQAAAVGLAASSLRYDDRPGKLSAAIGGGAWQGEGAFAAGLGYTSENQRIRLNISAANAGQHWGMGGGVSYTFN